MSEPIFANAGQGTGARGVVLDEAAMSDGMRLARTELAERLRLEGLARLREGIRREFPEVFAAEGVGNRAMRRPAAREAGGGQLGALSSAM